MPPFVLWSLVPCAENAYIIKVIPSKNTVSMNIPELKSISTGLIDAAIPRMKRRLNRFEPITLPTAISHSPFLAATIEVTSSGKEVPQATMVSPISMGLIPKDAAIADAESTTQSPPTIIRTIPTTKKIILLVQETAFTSSSTGVRFLMVFQIT